MPSPVLQPQPHLLTGIPPPHLTPGGSGGGPPVQMIGGEGSPAHMYNPSDMDYQNYGPTNEGQYGGGPPFRGARRGGRGGGRGRFIGQRGESFHGVFVLLIQVSVSVNVNVVAELIDDAINNWCLPWPPQAIVLVHNLVKVLHLSYNNTILLTRQPDIKTDVSRE